MSPKTSSRSIIGREKRLVANAGVPASLGARVRTILAAATSAPFPPSPTDPRLLLSDWSHWQGNVDIGKYLAYGPPKFRAVIIRTGQGHSSDLVDTQFLANAQKCEANKFPWMSYHVLLPNQDVPRQVGHLHDRINLLGGVLPKLIWWDVQVANNQSKRKVSEATIEAVRLTKQETGVDTGVYSAQWFTNSAMETQDWFADINWWIAQWLWPDQPAEHPWPTALPETVDISQVMIHQTTSFGDGRLVGMGSDRVDLDRWMWTEEQFNVIMGIDEPPPPSDLEEQVKANTEAIKALQEWASNLAFEE